MVGLAEEGAAVAGDPAGVAVCTAAAAMMLNFMMTAGRNILTDSGT